MEMEPLDRAPCFIDDLLNFGSDLGEEDEEEEKLKAALSSFSTQTNPDNLGRTFPDYAEEELEWLSNKDAFPSLETFVDIYATSSHAAPKQDNSPVSVLENVKSFSSFCASVRRARSKCCRKRRPGGFPELTSQQRRPGIKSNNDTACLKMTKLPSAGGPIGRRCWHCQADKTPQWRAGPAGPKTLCNACGVRYKSGRLVPEYRPARSPTFSDELHSNSHRKIMEMRRLKVMGNMTVNSG